MNKKSKANQSRNESRLLKAAKQAGRQLRYSRAARIPTSTEISVDNLLVLLDGSNQAPQATHPLAEALPTENLVRLLADLGTGLWRMKQRMVDPQTGDPLEQMRRPYRHLESMWDAFDRARIHIHDHTGEPLPERGFPGLKVVQRVPTPGLTREHITETIKPTISLKGSGANPDLVIQMGEILVGIPEHASGEHTVRMDGDTPKA